MFSYHSKKKLASTSDNSHVKSLLQKSIFQQKSLVNYWQKNREANSYKASNLYDKTQKQPISINKNDQNSSFNANRINQQDYKKENCSKIQNQNIFYQRTTQNLKRTLNQEEGQLKVINFKKKIKKCNTYQSHLQFAKQKAFYREHIKFYRKKQRTIKCVNKQNVDEKQQNQTKIQVHFQQFPVFKDSQVFSTSQCKQFSSRIVYQRIDNDAETDDEQMQKFMKKIKDQFLQHIQTVNRQRQNQHS